MLWEKKGAGYIVSSFAGAEEFVFQVTFSFILFCLLFFSGWDGACRPASVIQHHIQQDVDDDLGHIPV
jgi:hypothetical protein